MNPKRIKTNIRNKVKEWANTITDPSLKEAVLEDAIVTGGAIVSLLESNAPNDYDIYFKSKAVVKRVADYYVEIFNKNLETKAHENNFGYRTRAFVLDGADIEGSVVASDDGWKWKSAMLEVAEDRIKIIVRSDGVAGEKQEIDETLNPEELLSDGDDISQNETKKSTVKKDPYSPVFLTPNAITLTDKIQLVIRFYGEAMDIHENFDYIHCTSWYDYDGDYLHLPSEALTSIINKELIYSGSRYPIASIIRLRKFLKRGWHINAGQILKMSFQISNLDLTNPVVLEDQLVGVDTMYFKTIIYMLEQERANNEEFEITNEYFLSVVDKVFG